MLKTDRADKVSISISNGVNAADDVEDVEVIGGDYEGHDD